eukprot:1651909-Rhodomonas_salina.1
MQSNNFRTCCVKRFCIPGYPGTGYPVPVPVSLVPLALDAFSNSGFPGYPRVPGYPGYPGYPDPGPAFWRSELGLKHQ